MIEAFHSHFEGTAQIAELIERFSIEAAIHHRLIRTVYSYLSVEDHRGKAQYIVILKSGIHFGIAVWPAFGKQPRNDDLRIVHLGFDHIQALLGKCTCRAPRGTEILHQSRGRVIRCCLRAQQSDAGYHK